MNNKTEKRALLIVLPLIALACLGLWQIKNRTRAQDIYFDTATYDLRTFDFTQAMAHFSGVVEYVPGELLTPEEFARHDGVQTGRLPPGTEVSTMRIRLQVAPGMVYSFTGPAPNFASKLYVNGAWLRTVGRPALRAEEETPADVRLNFSAQPQDGMIEIVCQNSNFSHRDSPGGLSLYIGRAEDTIHHAAKQAYTDVAVMAWYGLLFVVHLLLFLLVPGYRANLWLCLNAVVWALRTGITGTRPLSNLLPGLGWSLSYRLEIMAIPITFLLLVLAYHDVCKGAFPKRFLQVCMALGGGWALVCLFPGTHALSLLALWVQLTLAAASVLAGVFLARYARRVRFGPMQGVMLGGLLLVLFAFGWDIAYYNGLLPFLHFALLQPVLVIFSLFQLAAMLLGTVRQAAMLQAVADEARAEVAGWQALYSTIPPENAMVCGPLALDTLAGKAFLNGQDLLLAPKEFALLKLLVQNQGQPVPARQLYEEVWKQPLAGDTQALKSSISRLRKKLAGAFSITATRGKGYCFTGEAEE